MRCCEESHTFLENVRAGDVACRLGGDEFVILMPGASLDAAISKAQQLDQQLKIQGVECSTGVATYPDHGSSCAELLKSADAALYRAKAAGGARVTCSTPFVLPAFA